MQSSDRDSGSRLRLAFLSTYMPIWASSLVLFCCLLLPAGEYAMGPLGRQVLTPGEYWRHLGPEIHGGWITLREEGIDWVAEP